ncbi:MAG: gamma-glutamyl-gamma-aminobutyrate hydrolase family protein [Symbiobacteriaceae bacterium]|nr:gamma-glutamyl-gamma-aminobutyrate hydrolase family protein [Symbiobacteriaceae bacterium]
MGKPIIGVSVNFSFNERIYSVAETYVESLKKAGGIPVLLPHIPDDAETLAEKMDGLLISGGPDLDPAYYGENPWPKLGSICPERDESEIALLKAFLKTGKPILGICRGEQALNVVLGGTIYQDLATQYPDAGLIKHAQEGPRWYTSHQASIVPGSRLHSIFSELDIRVNSFHHQGVKDLGKGLVVAARAADGVIEAYEMPDHRFCVGVQWHPECMFELASRSDKLFSALVEACRD